MLIRVRGGKGGISEYLEKGHKNGRDYSREELDQRVILDGDLTLVHNIINTMEGDAQRYLHITLSFKEDHIDEATLHAITQDFKAFAMTAYQEEEYAFYAEAHLPKIKSYVDKSTGETVERKPHIHVVIPQKNLLTGKRLEPFGLVEKNGHFIDAFQEVSNEKYQLASPKHHVRTTFTNESTIISRHKADLFPAQHRDTKSKALEVLLRDSVTIMPAFVQQLRASGFEVKIRNQGKDNEYINIKSPEQKRGINLKENVFQPQFVTLPKAEKLKRLDNTHNPYRENGNSQYKATPKHHRDLQHWNTFRAYELRYVHRRNRQMYKALTPEQKQQFLNEKRSTHGQPHIPKPSMGDINQALRAASQYLHHAQRHHGSLKSGVRHLTHRRALRTAFAHIQRHTSDQSPPDIKRDTSDRLSQLQFDIKNQALPNIQHIKQHLDAQALLHRLAITHGVDISKYTITKGKDGGARIRCGNRHLNVSDFLTKEMHMPWKEAKHYLEDRYLAQQSIKTQPEPNLIQAAWRSQRQHEREQRQAYLAHYRLEKAAIYSDKTLSKTERNIALSIAQMNKVIQDLHFKRECQNARKKLINAYKDGLTMNMTKEKSTAQDKMLSPESTQFYDQHLQASRVLLQYPQLKELGIRAESITKTENGDKIQYGEKSLTLSQLMKETLHLKPKEIVSELKPLYETQLKDNERILQFKNHYMSNERQSLSERESNKTHKTNKFRPKGVEATLSPMHEQEREHKVLVPEPNKFGEYITHQTNKQGHVTYYQGDEKLVTDRGKTILIEQATNNAVEIGLRLAIEKYGNHLDIKGTQEYKQQVIDIAVTNKLNISFKDKALNEQLMERKAQFEKGEYIITKAESTYKSSAKQAAKEQHQTKEPAHQQPQKQPKGWER
ncbi:LPD7 domain-containing protein [Vibrio cholerae]|uniref:LPD7 domain-containing protein n=1 Tax=Vibrio cholerae TaxID=666 RepID=UPI0030809496